MGSEGAKLGPIGGAQKSPLVRPKQPPSAVPKGFLHGSFFFFARLKPMGRGNPAPNPCGHLWVKGGAGIKDLFYYGGLLAPKLLPTCPLAVLGGYGMSRGQLFPKNLLNLVLVRLEVSTFLFWGFWWLGAGRAPVLKLYPSPVARASQGSIHPSTKRVLGPASSAWGWSHWSC